MQSAQRWAGVATAGELVQADGRGEQVIGWSQQRRDNDDAAIFSQHQGLHYRRALFDRAHTDVFGRVWLSYHLTVVPKDHLLMSQKSSEGLGGPGRPLKCCQEAACNRGLSKIHLGSGNWMPAKIFTHCSNPSLQPFDVFAQLSIYLQLCSSCTNELGKKKTESARVWVPFVFTERIPKSEIARVRE